MAWSEVFMLVATPTALGVFIALRLNRPRHSGWAFERRNVRVGGRWVRAEIVKRNPKTRWYRLVDGNTIKRRAGRDYAEGGLFS